MEFKPGDSATVFSNLLLKNGLIAKPTHGNIIRFSPPLIMTKSQVDESLEVIQKSWNEFQAQHK